MCSPFYEASSEMHVEDMHDSIRAKLDVGLQHAALFPSFVGHIVVLPALERKAGKGHVAVVAAVQRTVRSKTYSIIPQGSRNLASLVELRTPGWSIHHLLQADNICVQLADYFDDSLRTYSSVEPLALVNVVCGNPETDLVLLTAAARRSIPTAPAPSRLWAGVASVRARSCRSLSGRR